MKEITKIIIAADGAETKEVITSHEENQCVELTVDSKGKVKPTVKVYDDDIEAAKDKAVKIMDELLAKYGDD
jgi:hypothetical protein